MGFGFGWNHHLYRLQLGADPWWDPYSWGYAWGPRIYPALIAWGGAAYSLRGGAIAWEPGG